MSSISSTVNINYKGNQHQIDKAPYSPCYANWILADGLTHASTDRATEGVLQEKSIKALDLYWPIHQLRDTETKQIPDSKKLTRFLTPCFSTACLVAYVAALVLMNLTPFSLLLISVPFIIAMGGAYGWSNGEINFAEMRISEDGKPKGPWFAPDIDTRRGKHFAASVIGPVLGGLLLPFYETFTRPARWENAATIQRQQIELTITRSCAFLAEWATTLADRVAAEKSNPPRHSFLKPKDYNDTIDYLVRLSQFYGKFEPVLLEKATLILTKYPTAVSAAV
ncbi:MAG: hypothetical protein KGJ02_01130 [Verrucomicrobiota bacterium]|nr:hypothetical protein [Verrucomicrobiota bacterium]